MSFHRRIAPTTAAAVVLLAGCASGPSIEQQRQQMSSMSIHEYLGSKGWNQPAQKVSGMQVSSRVYTQDESGPRSALLGKRSDITWVERLCEAHRGTLRFVAADDLRHLMPSGTSEEQILLAATAGTNASRRLANSIDERGSGSVGRGVAASFANTENAGTFDCAVAGEARPKWRFTRHIWGATNGFRGAILSVPSGSRLTIQETFSY